MKIVFVGFDCNEENSLMYKKVELSIPNENMENFKEERSYFAEIVGRQLFNALKKGCDFVSIRFIK